jgi:hypothetical protein
MHGHGSKPFSCRYRECDRAAPGNGFPRRWNLRDHMKRVHDYNGPVDDNEAPPYSGSHGQKRPNQASRKRRTTQTPDATNTKTRDIAKGQKQRRGSAKQLPVPTDHFDPPISMGRGQFQVSRNFTPAGNAGHPLYEMR